MSGFPSLTYKNDGGAFSINGENGTTNEKNQGGGVINNNNNNGNKSLRKSRNHSRQNSSNIKSDIDKGSKSLLKDFDETSTSTTIDNNNNNNSLGSLILPIGSSTKIDLTTKDSPSTETYLSTPSPTSSALVSPTLSSTSSIADTNSSSSKFPSTAILVSASDLVLISDQKINEKHPIKQRLQYVWQWLVHQVRTATYQTWLKLLLVALIIVGICLAIFVFKVQHHLDVLQKFVEKFGILVGGVVYIGIFTLLIIFCVPVTIPTILAGIIFKLWFASMLGGIIAFLMGRYVFRKSIVKYIERNKKLQAVDQAIGQEGWKIVLLLRLTPIVPESLLNYALAVTNVKLTHYIICSAVGLVPGCSFFIYLGTMIGNISDIGKRHIQKGEIAMYVVSGVAMCFTIVFITVIVRRAVNKKLNVEEKKGLLDEEANVGEENQDDEELDDQVDQEEKPHIKDILAKKVAGSSKKSKRSKNRLIEVDEFINHSGDSLTFHDHSDSQSGSETEDHLLNSSINYSDLQNLQDPALVDLMKNKN
ncbi:hypothetical protein DFA_10390 [Cavenderia fasciculata]|uniref:VTT domain-containing protein n=1 Tax=Cavenderia fasciculata TaxID=261658 RepID=F4QA29_CACFS|nr:uncharacterized protein DFA_10390 [Cavenderia fasciculata]EGG15548.1 hypothetical protein DFA_10390 [Cavenderia fasciculata]|eukprot:XP_004354290.1 hypothetical protein DFA_10390 [Cavenderia fasciculata]